MIYANLSRGKVMLLIHKDTVKWACNNEVCRGFEVIGYKTLKLSSGPDNQRKNWPRRRKWSVAIKVIFPLSASKASPSLQSLFSLKDSNQLFIGGSSSSSNNNKQENNVGELYIKRVEKDFRRPQNRKHLQLTWPPQGLLECCFPESGKD